MPSDNLWCTWEVWCQSDYYSLVGDLFFNSLWGFKFFLFFRGKKFHSVSRCQFVFSNSPVWNSVYPSNVKFWVFSSENSVFVYPIIISLCQFLFCLIWAPTQQMLDLSDCSSLPFQLSSQTFSLSFKKIFYKSLLRPKWTTAKKQELKCSLYLLVWSSGKFPWLYIVR